ncbi:cytochrome P450 monooxygenase [Aspergillus costaricaensis CBS 115574]|uniref:Cytochrome P450 monooxygenase n=1 Tax=Aspergillus costaricaensis CBS 115574 TaxID=1448317 RepID=A0ACD1IQ91_9EURO|nr:cytochrome P450 monooxygenase [Aspergillus costaricaensis CBS 115574]RAK91925.1 cytochrome P450 monooxygenase [Aspergillus costaricaensis CBS 115574]
MQDYFSLGQIGQISLCDASRILFTLFGSYVVLRLMYNRYFHPLRNFPGPIWGSLTDFYKLYIVAQKDAHTRGIEMHKKYGPIVRVAPNLLAFSDPLLLPVVYHRRADKTEFYSTGILGDIPPPFQTLKHEDHAAKRKRIAPSFSMSNLRRLESDMDVRILEFCSTLRTKHAKTGDPLDFAEYAQWFVYDLVTQLAFGSPVGFVRETRDIGGLIHHFHDMAPLAGFIAALPWLANPIFQNPLFKKYLMPKPGDSTGTGQIMKFRDDMLEHRLKDRFAEGYDDFLSNLLKARNEDGSLMTIEEIKTECFVLMVAASDTTSAFICPFVNYVVQNPQIYHSLMEEITTYERKGLLSNPVVKYDETNAMPYFMACVKETLRYSPSTPMIMPRYIAKDGIKVLNDTYIPGGTEMGANPYVVHRDTKIYGHDAHLFRPERWLEDEARSKEMDKYLMSFGYGSRVCLGKNIAQLETQKLCCQLFRDFTIDIVDRNNPWEANNLAIMVFAKQFLRISERTATSVSI